MLQICRQESDLEKQLLGQEVMKQNDLLPSVRNLKSLAVLYRSVVRLNSFTVAYHD